MSCPASLQPDLCCAALCLAPPLLLPPPLQMKRVLTTNSEAPVNVECIMNDIDVHGEIKREVFEAEAQGVLDRLVEPVRKVRE